MDTLLEFTLEMVTVVENVRDFVEVLVDEDEVGAVTE